MAAEGLFQDGLAEGFAALERGVDLSLEVVAEDDDERRAYRGVSTVGDTKGAVVEFEGRVVALDEVEGAARARRNYQILCGAASSAEGR